MQNRTWRLAAASRSGNDRRIDRQNAFEISAIAIRSSPIPPNQATGWECLWEVFRAGGVGTSTVSLSLNERRFPGDALGTTPRTEKNTARQTATSREEEGRGITMGVVQTPVQSRPRRRQVGQIRSIAEHGSGAPPDDPRRKKVAKGQRQSAGVVQIDQTQQQPPQ